MREVFQQELHEVQERLIEISALVAISIENATRAFNESNVSLAETVIEQDRRIDELATSLDELAINILARQQPVARDLRIVVSALRISASLERMGDLAEHIAQLSRYRFPDKVVPKSLRPTFLELGQLDVAIARKLTDLLTTEDPKSPRRSATTTTASTSCTSASSTRCSARPGRARPSTRSTPRSPAATTSASPTTRCPSRRPCSTSRPATGCRPTPDPAAGHDPQR